MGGTWVVFRHYLSVRPWSSPFPTSSDVVDSQVVWIKFLGLLEYSKVLLKAISQLVRPVVRINVNIMLEKRGIEGRLQVVEYEGLSNVYFRCGVSGNSSELCQETKMIPKEDESNNRAPEPSELNKASKKAQLGGQNEESMARASIVKVKGKGKGKGLDVGSGLKKNIVEIRLAMEEIVETIDRAVVQVIHNEHSASCIEKMDADCD
ncbi:hypothetical protein Goshw_009877, partial [Gossypium schwendimanii]|nr:hypothetical protein [Gossypium schwendimanii]